MNTAALQYVPAHFREPTADDVAFIYNSWLKSFRGNSAWAKDIPAQIFYDNHKRVLARILGESGVVVACNPESPEQIFGYGVYQPTSAHVAVVHFVYVKHPFRRLGIGRAIHQTALRLAEHDDSLPSVATHITSAWEVLREKWNMVYNPYMIGASE